MMNITPKTNKISDESDHYMQLLEGIFDEDESFSEQELGEVNESLALESDIEVESESYEPESESGNELESENEEDLVSEESEFDNKKDARISLEVSSDKLSAYVKITPPDGGKAITAKDIYNLLNEKNITYGVDSEKIEELENSPIYEEAILIAKGEDAQNGKNGELTLNFNIKGRRKPKVLEGGGVDYKDLNYIESVKEGDVLCTVTLPVAGVSGKDVYGNEIKAVDGKPAALPKGKNAEISEDGLSLIACNDGCVEYISGKVSVYKQLDIPDSIDASTGNIKFSGNVYIKGDVLTGYKVESEGSIFVDGIVEAATLEAGVDVLLKKGVAGSGKADIKAGKNVISKYIENATVHAKKNIQAEAIMHSRIKAGKRIELIGKKALLVGGQIGAGEEVIAGVIGSDMGTSTQVNVGLDPEVRERYFEINDIITKKEENLESLNKAVTTLNKLKQMGKADKDKIERLKKILEAIGTLKQEVEVLKEEYEDIKECFKSTSSGIVKVKNKLFPGTRISIGEPVYIVRDFMKATTIKRSGADIVAVPM